MCEPLFMVCGTQPITHTWACITGIQTVAHAHTHVTASAWCHGPVVFADTIQLLPSSSVHIHTTHTHTHTHTPFVDLVFGKRFQRPPQDFSLSCLLRRLSLFLTSGRSSTSGQAPKKTTHPGHERLKSASSKNQDFVVRGCPVV